MTTRKEIARMAARSKRSPLWVLLVAALPGCVGEIGDADRRAVTDGAGQVQPNAHSEPVTDVPALDSPTVIVKPAATRRLTVDELQASLAVVAGLDAAGAPIGWKVAVGSKKVDGLANEGFGKTLGRPDFVTTTEEDPSPNALWGKFTQDMARNVCGAMVLADLARAAGDPPTLWPHAPVDTKASPVQLRTNLAYLVMRFWGFDKDESAGAVEALLAVHAAGAAADVPEDAVPREAEGWRAVCVALIEDPAFHLH